MPVIVESRDDAVVVTVPRMAALFSGRRRLTIPIDQIAGARAVDRDRLEARVDHRVIGIGEHDGGRRPGRRRIGMMIGRDVVGNQFWAVDAGPADQQLLVLELDPPVGPFVRAVLTCTDPIRLADRLDGRAR